MDMLVELKTILAENLAEMERVYPADKQGRSDYAEGYKDGYKLACSHLLAAMERKTGSLTHPAVLLGQRGGQSTSEAKAAAARENGKKGGRPRKTGQD